MPFGGNTAGESECTVTCVCPMKAEPYQSSASFRDSKAEFRPGETRSVTCRAPSASAWGDLGLHSERTVVVKIRATGAISDQMKTAVRDSESATGSGFSYDYCAPKCEALEDRDGECYGSSKPDPPHVGRSLDHTVYNDLVPSKCSEGCTRGRLLTPQLGAGPSSGRKRNESDWSFFFLKMIDY